MSSADPLTSTAGQARFASTSELFRGGWVVQLTAGEADSADARVESLDEATVQITPEGVFAATASGTWAWMLDDVEDAFHGGAQPWTILAISGIADHGVAVRPAEVERFRRELGELLRPSTTLHTCSHVAASPERPTGVDELDAAAAPLPEDQPDLPSDDWTEVLRDAHTQTVVLPRSVPPDQTDHRRPSEGTPRSGDRTPPAAGATSEFQARPSTPGLEAAGLADLEARAISAWFGTHHVLDRVSLDMAAGRVTALIGPSGCGKSTFLRILNRMHELIPSASMAGEVLLDGGDIYETGRKVTEARRQIGMVFQKPNPFPAMSIYDNVVASFQLTGSKVSAGAKDDVVESCLRKAGLWNEVRERLRQPGGSLSGGQQQRLCIARALAIRPRVLLMDEPCSALDPTSTRRIEQTIAELASEVTIVIVTHNMQQAARVSSSCAFFLAEQGTPGVIVEHGPTDAMFNAPRDQRTSDYVNGRFG